MRIPLQISDLIEDVIDQYVLCRKGGDSRDVAVSKIKDSFQDELADTDDAALVHIGLILALSKKKELTKNIAAEASCCIESAIKSFEESRKISSYMSSVLAMLNDPDVFGDEARYPRRNAYIPDWQIGDLFTHTLSSPKAQKLGIHGWAILMYKVGEYWNNPLRLNQLMLVSLCHQDSVPTTKEQLQELRWLRMMPEGTGWAYLAQLHIKNKKEEDFCDLKKVGNFLEFTPPSDAVKENPFVSVPLFGRIRKEDLFPDFEDKICFLYNAWGQM